ncbi:transport permease protein [Devosia pacifica]|uniref:Transport permease protein n=1 Tax=Devosia pacifica TaxID=1335967 RepID=A0A918SBF0_9HYPH|nr:ABC transporter permease [Devosia pacifica]GHA32594.1 transport permease protein [Devosia pacifica]
MLNSLASAAWRYRYFILASIQGDFRSRVARSRLGFLWIILVPLAQVAIYAFILSALMTQRLPGIDNRFAYSLYLLAGFSGWFLFLEVINRCVTIFLDNAEALKKIAFPRIVLPIIVVGSSVINNLVFFGLVVLAYVLLGHDPLPAIAWYPLLTLITAAGAAGLGLSLGVLNVFMRDVGQIVGIALQFGFWMTPIVYMVDILPESVRPILMLNPMYWVLDSYHRTFLYGLPPQPLALLGLSVLAVGLLALALMLFRRASAEMVDVL